MADLVRVRVNGIEFNVGAAYAEAKGLSVIDAPTHRKDGMAIGPTRNGRRAKPKTSVAEAAAKKAAKSADTTVTDDNAKES